MHKKHLPEPDREPRPLGNESTDPFSPTLPPGSLHEVLREGGEQPAKNDRKAADEEE
ncbi:MAG: hypothetical protein IT230_05515 [Flavobacteriales bacterium]|nr:hypothetical protein [Flavobacteriales bacterium]